uniref:Putative catalytically inactive chitinase-like lectins n=1 Tax=Ixodes ricinus TaxID=34613 RepID=V5IDF6_IXORI
MSHILMFATFSQTVGSVFFDKQCKVPYAFNKKLWISYDDVESLELKAKWIRSENFGGIMTFSLNCDDHRGAHSENAVTFPPSSKDKRSV